MIVRICPLIVVRMARLRPGGKAMARPLNVRRPKTVEVQQLQKKLAGLTNHHQQRRAVALLMYGMGLDPLLIAQAQSVHVNTIYADLHAFATAGIAAVTQVQSAGAPTRITASQVDRIA